MTDLTKPERAALRVLCEKATRGPWLARPDKHDDWGVVRALPQDELALGRIVARAAPGREVSAEEEREHRRNGTDPYGHNTAFIAASRDALPRALDQIERLEEALRFYRDAWNCKPHPLYGGLEWSPKEELLDDCGNRASDALSASGSPIPEEPRT